MITRPRQLAARRDALVAQAALLRGRAADASAEIQRTLGWAERAVALVRGATGRDKTVAIEGLAPDEIARRLVG